MGQSEPDYSDNVMTAHQAFGKSTPVVYCVREKCPTAISAHWPAGNHLWRNEMTMQWMKNVSSNAFQYISLLKAFHPMAIVILNLDQSQLSFILQAILLVLVDLAHFSTLRMP